MTWNRVLGVLAALIVLTAVVVSFFVWRGARRADQAAMTPAAPTEAPARGTSAATPTPRGDVSIDPRRQQLVGVRTVKATKGELSHTIRTVGVVRSDETRVVDVNVKIEGWIRELTADYTGRFVRQGEPLLTLYSPDLLATEQEYVLALAARDQLQASVMPDAKLRADALVAAARQRLALWDLAPEEFRDLDESRKAKDALVVRAPASGFVIEKAVVKGAHVTPGQMLFKLADLSVVWVEAEVYEQDVSLVRVGARATVLLDAYPGDRTIGRVIYISPYVDEQTRTNKVRYESPNPRGQLKPGMFATVEMATSGGIGVTVPTDAVLDSGRDQIVFVAEGDGHFTPRPVTTGRRLGGTIEILKGVKEGEEIAGGATFFLDSESQLRGALQGYAPISPSPTTGPAQNADRPQISLRTIPDPPRTGENQFEVTVADSHGAPVVDAEVSVQLFMAAMPTMNMPAMRNEMKLPSVGNGVYRATGQVMMAGRWEATVTVTRGGQKIGSLQTPVAAR